MKSIIKYACLFFLFTSTFLIMTDIEQRTTRKDEMEEALSISMRNTLKASTYSPMYEMDERDMQVELIRNLGENITTDSAFNIKVMGISKEGLLDIQLHALFTHNNGVLGSETIRKSLIVESSAQ